MYVWELECNKQVFSAYKRNFTSWWSTELLVGHKLTWRHVSIMTTQITGIVTVCSIAISDWQQRNSEALHNCPLVMESTGDRWILSQRTGYRNRSQIMTPSWVIPYRLFTPGPGCTASTLSHLCGSFPWCQSSSSQSPTSSASSREVSSQGPLLLAKFNCDYGMDKPLHLLFSVGYILTLLKLGHGCGIAFPGATFTCKV